VRELQAEGKPIELRGGNKVVEVTQEDERRRTDDQTRRTGPTGCRRLADRLRRRGSPIRAMMGLDFVGRVFEDNFLIADVVMEAKFPTERWFWFDPPFNRGQSALLHKQPDNVWRIDLQLGWDIDRPRRRSPRTSPRLKAMLGEDVKFELEWARSTPSSAGGWTEVPPGPGDLCRRCRAPGLAFGARGANSGLQDTDNLAWKLKLMIDGKSPGQLLDSYDASASTAPTRTS
jgi:3-(3-hydroxy-phenyl)propionate hydroxylase